MSAAAARVSQYTPEALLEALRVAAEAGDARAGDFLPTFESWFWRSDADQKTTNPNV